RPSTTTATTTRSRHAAGPRTSTATARRSRAAGAARSTGSSSSTCGAAWTGSHATSSRPTASCCIGRSGYRRRASEQDRACALLHAYVPAFLPVRRGGGEDLVGELGDEGGDGLGLGGGPLRGVVVGRGRERAGQPLAVLHAVEVADGDGDGHAVERSDLVRGHGHGRDGVALDDGADDGVGGVLVGLEVEAGLVGEALDEGVG